MDLQSGVAGREWGWGWDGRINLSSCDCNVDFCFQLKTLSKLKLSRSLLNVPNFVLIMKSSSDLVLFFSTSSQERGMITLCQIISKAKFFDSRVNFSNRCSLCSMRISIHFHVQNSEMFSPFLPMAHSHCD